MYLSLQHAMYFHSNGIKRVYMCIMHSMTLSAAMLCCETFLLLLKFKVQSYLLYITCEQLYNYADI